MDENRFLVSSFGFVSSAPETDRMVEAIQRLGVDRGLYGARISGGGSGGTVVILCQRDVLDTLTEQNSVIRCLALRRG
jgi:galactokinase